MEIEGLRAAIVMANNLEKSEIDIGEYAPYPGPRYESDGEFSGEWFRDQILIPELEKNPISQLLIYLDGVPGFPSSFLEEVFGGLVRKRPEWSDSIGSRLRISARSEHMKVFVELAKNHLKQALAIT